MLFRSKPYEIADIYQTIHPDKLDNFFKELIDKKLEGDELGQERYKNGLLDPFEIMSDEVPRFVSVDDLRKVAEKNGFDIERRPDDIYPPKGQEFSELQKVVIESAVQDFHHGIDIGDLNDEYRANIQAILGEDRPSARLPEHIHMELARKLLDAENYRTWIESTLQSARWGNVPNLSLAQTENVASIITNWLRLHPFN